MQSIDRAALIAAKEQWYVPSNTLAIAAGNVDHDDFVERLNQHIPRDTRTVSHLTWEDEYDELPAQQEVIIERQREKAIVIFGCKFPLYTDTKNTALMKFLEYALVKGTGPLLWRELREKRGLAYSLSGGITMTPALGAYFQVYVETKPDRIDTVRELVSLILFQPFVY